MDGAGVSFDLFGTLVAVDRPSDIPGRVAAELDARGVSVPDDWHTAFSEHHLDVPEGRELSLPAHTAAALSSRSEPLDPADVREDAEWAVLTAFETEVRTRPGAVRAVETLTDRVPVGVLSNCGVPGLVGRVLDESAINKTVFDAVVASVDCGWRKPHPWAFAAVADELDVPTDGLFHVGDDPTTDGGAETVGARSYLISDGALTDLPATLEERWK